MYNGDTKTDSFEFTDVQVGPDSKGSVVLKEGGVPSIEYDYDGDSVVDRVIAPGSEAGDVELTTEQYLAQLKEQIKNASLPRSVRRWLELKVRIVERLIQRKSKLSERIVEKQLDSISRTLERYADTDRRGNKEIHTFFSQLREHFKSWRS